MPADIRSFWGGPRNPRGTQRLPKEEKLEEPAATVLPKKAKAEEPKPDVDMVDLTDDESGPKTVAAQDGRRRCKRAPIRAPNLQIHVERVRCLFFPDRPDACPLADSPHAPFTTHRMTFRPG